MKMGVSTYLRYSGASPDSSFQVLMIIVSHCNLSNSPFPFY